MEWMGLMVNVKPVKLGRNERMSFARINEVLEMPNLIEVQKNSYQWFLAVSYTHLCTIHTLLGRTKCNSKTRNKLPVGRYI